MKDSKPEWSQNRPGRYQSCHQLERIPTEDRGRSPQIEWIVKLLQEIHQELFQDCKALCDFLKGPDKKGHLSGTRRERWKTAKQRGQQSSREPVKWTSECQGALKQLITAIINPPVMAYPNYSEPFILHTDASEQGLGGALYQRQDGKLRVIAYGSRTLTAAVRNYHLHSSKLEFLALKWAITEQFRDYLYYAPHFTVYTDSNPLTYILTPLPGLTLQATAG